MSTKKSLFIPRRQVIRGILSTTAFAATSRLWTGCTPAKEVQANSMAKISQL
jgi:simple sugar transport system substrate-binding protein